ncbi:galectin-1-like [Gracilinanus agilis]|uniref:galectin-1-like n=1 Tax=Gracilinanus agilis TaxID=191870 RepID=UPI001CFF3F7F|nr:galectin-1-like [Gracilinanus agilis]
MNDCLSEFTVTLPDTTEGVHAVDTPLEKDKVRIPFGISELRDSLNGRIPRLWAHDYNRDVFSISSFVINLGQDHDTIGCHFDARFNRFNDRNIAVCNYKKEDGWGNEQKDSNFPFQPGTLTKVSLYFEKSAFRVILPNGHEIQFPNRLNLDTINLLEVKADIELKSLTFK